VVCGVVGWGRVDPDARALRQACKLCSLICGATPRKETVSPE